MLLDSLTINARVNSALKTLETNDTCLFEISINERSLCARLAMYLRDEFPEYDVDCEYNRNITEDDFLKRLRNKYYLELLGKTISPSDTDGVTVYPDIIVHKRRSAPEVNLLVIEVKKSSNKTDSKIDLAKLRAFKKELHYQYARFIVFGTKGEKKLILKNRSI